MATQPVRRGLRFLTTDPRRSPAALSVVFSLIVVSLLLVQVMPSSLRDQQAPLVAADNPAQMAAGFGATTLTVKKTDTELAAVGQNLARLSQPLWQRSAAAFACRPHRDLTLVDLEVRMQI